MTAETTLKLGSRHLRFTHSMTFPASVTLHKRAGRVANIGRSLQSLRLYGQRKERPELPLLRQLLDRRIRKESDCSHISNEDYPCNQYCPKQCRDFE